MAIQRQINRTVESLFDSLRDLVTEISFANGTVGEYTFGADTDATVTTTTVTVEGVVIGIERIPGDRPFQQAEVLFRKPEVMDIDVYDTATFNGSTWTIYGFQDNQYTITAQFRKEV